MIRNNITTEDRLRRVRSDKVPRPGDRVIYVTEKGDRYEKAVIIGENDGRGGVAVRLNPGRACCAFDGVPGRVPKVMPDEIGAPVTRTADIGRMRFIGWTETLFRDIDFHHPSPVGAVSPWSDPYPVRVPLWHYSEPGPFLKTHSMQCFQKNRFWRRANEYTRNKPDYVAMDTYYFQRFSEKEFRQLVEDCEGQILPGEKKDELIVLTPRIRLVVLKREEYDELNLMPLMRRYNGKRVEVKLLKDRERNTIYCYRSIKSKKDRNREKDGDGTQTKHRTK